MSKPHRFYLSLGSNIRPASNLAEAIHQLRTHGTFREISSVWESRAVGSSGPNYLNLCVSFVITLGVKDLKARILRPVEATLGRVRSGDKNAPRTIDIDPLMIDDRPLSLRRWANAFVVLPMAELWPELIHPVTHKPLSEVARETQGATWIMRRPKALTRSR